MNLLSARIQNLAESETLAMSQRSSELKASGIDVINLSVGEPDFFTPKHIKEAAKEAIDSNFSFYPPVSGYLTLRKAICRKLLETNQLQYTPEQIICSNGAKQALCETLLCLINTGDEVIIPAPYWVSYIEMVKLAEGKEVIIKTDINNNFKITAEQLRAAITSKTKVFMLCSPSNPSGSIYTREELSALAEVLREFPDVFVISDEIYEYISYVGKVSSLATHNFLKDRIAVINGVSKGYAMTGWRIGWVATPLVLARAIAKLQGQFTSAASSIAQKAAEAAYCGDNSCVEQMRKSFENRRNLIVTLARQIPGFDVLTPDGAFYIFPVCSYYFGKTTPEGKVIENSSDLAMYLLDNAHVASVGGDAFGVGECIRFSYATSEELITKAFRRIDGALRQLK
ncbi:MAG: pyridoxal phosphate-dependent aminotransferase [Prevotellaceae bacterium]|jgi:aspartate aminotransferase|nr:pyridoxal phosphate-dependent aminotransferase [Prevotellaceae bacterium]